MSRVCSIHARDDCLEWRIEKNGKRQLVCVDSGYVHITEEAGRSPDALEVKPAAIGRSEDWNRAEAWSDAISDVIFDGRHAGRPVYLDLDEALLDEISQQLVPPPQDPEGDLVEAATRPLVPIGRHWLRPAVRRAAVWRRSGSGGPPPVLSVLAILVLAAEKMRSDDDMSSHNYYGRLTVDVLGLDESERDTVAVGYRESAPTLFGALNEWLTEDDGARGLPTAQAGAHLNSKYVYYAISQALLREGDRDSLARFFSLYGLTPGTAISVDDMSRLLRDCVSRASINIGFNIEGVVRAGGQRLEHLASLVAEELQNWDGIVPGAENDENERLASDLRLSLSLGGFPRPSVRLSLVARARRRGLEWHPSPEVEEVLGQRGTSTAREIADGWALLESEGQTAWSAALARSITVELGGEVLRRGPSRVVVLRHEPALSRWLETDRVVAGEDVLILAVEGAAGRVASALGSCARPGWDRQATMEGLPSGWTLFTGVQIMSAPDSENKDLSALAPSAHESLTMAGGLRLPGQPRRWHRAEPPEVRLSLLGEDAVTLRLRCVRVPQGETPVETTILGTYPGVAVISLDGHKDTLAAGDYQVEVLQGEISTPEEDAKVLMAGQLRLRSGDRVAVSRIGDQSLYLGHEAGTFRAGLAAVPVSRKARAMQGAATCNFDSKPPAWDTTPPQTPAWVLERRVPTPTDVDERAITVEAPRCFTTGAHYFDLDKASRHGGMWDTVCEFCGVRRFFPTGPVKDGEWKAKREEAIKQITEASSVTTLSKVDRLDLSPDTVLDALTHLRHGSASELNTVLRSGLDALQAHTLLRNLEALGHVEVERDEDFMSTRWSIAPATLTVLPAPENEANGTVDAILAGARNALLVEEIEAAAELVGADVTRDRQPGPAPQRIAVRADDLETLERLVQLVEVDGLSFGLSNSAASRAVEIMLPMAELLEGLPKRRPPSRVALKRLDLQQVKWQRVAAMDMPGVYRVDLGYRSFQCLRTTQDIADGQIRVGPQEVVKHAAVAAFRRNLLIAYRDGELIAPSLVGLPGLLERAAVLCSGFVAEERTNGQRVYRGVPEAIACGISRKLTPE